MAYDKKLHILAGFLISLIIGYLFNPIIGLQLSLLAGIGKEIYDYCDHGGFDVFDMLATWCGGVVGYIAGVIL